MMTKRQSRTVAVFEAYGHTGRFVAAELRRREIGVILSGRDRVKLDLLGPVHPDSDLRLNCFDSHVWSLACRAAASAKTSHLSLATSCHGRLRDPNAIASLKTARALSFTEIVIKKSDADRIDRRAQARRHYVYRHGGLQRAGPTRRQSRSRATGGTSPFVARNLSAVSRHRNQNHR